MRKTAKEIVEETVQYYGQDPVAKRAMSTQERGKCCYLTSDGRMCAVGRCLRSPEHYLYDSESVAFICSGDNQVLDDMLKPEYRGHPISFWQSLQELHDLNQNWDKQGITQAGIMAVKRIIAEYQEPETITENTSAHE